MTARHFAGTANLAFENLIFLLNGILFEAIIVSLMVIIIYLIFIVVIRDDFMVMRYDFPNSIALPMMTDKITGQCDW